MPLRLFILDARASADAIVGHTHAVWGDGAQPLVALQPHNMYAFFFRCSLLPTAAGMLRLLRDWDAPHSKPDAIVDVELLLTEMVMGGGCLVGGCAWGRAPNQRRRCS